MRGKQTEDVNGLFNARITPARAGKTMRVRLLYAKREDHPRACGENNGMRFLVIGKIGSPPRVRGKLEPNTKRDPDNRITPARAGKTQRGGT